jgi:hypothetical protein
MRLFRIGGAATGKREDSVHRLKDDLEVRILFKNFGLGSERTSDFRVELGWDDVDKFIVEFATMKHPKAVELLNARSLGGWGT